MKRFNCFLVLLLVSVSYLRGEAGVLNFDNLALANFDQITSPYGSGIDAHVSIGFRTYNPSNDSTLSNALGFWNSDYGDLQKVAFAESNGFGAEISFTPDPGYAVVLSSFDMAGWFQVDRTLRSLQITDNSGVRFSVSNHLINGAGGTHTSFSFLAISQ